MQLNANYTRAIEIHSNPKKRKMKSTTSILSSSWPYANSPSIATKLLSIHAYTENRNTLDPLRHEASILFMFFTFCIFYSPDNHTFKGKT